MLIQAAWAAIRVRGRLQARYNRLVRRFGGDKNPGAKKKAITAIAHTLLKIAYQVLKTGTPYQEPGADFYTRRESPEQQAGLAGAPAAKAAPRLHHHHHHQPPGGRLNARRLTTQALIPTAPEPPPTRHPALPAGQPTPSPSLATAQAKVRCRAPTGTRFPCQSYGNSRASGRPVVCGCGPVAPVPKDNPVGTRGTLSPEVAFRQ